MSEEQGKRVVYWAWSFTYCYLIFIIAYDMFGPIPHSLMRRLYGAGVLLAVSCAALERNLRGRER